MPGRLSVARTFGDPEAKILALGGNPNVVIHNPEIKSFQIKKDHDFIVLGCDGIFDKLNNTDTTMCVWKAAYDNKHHPSVKGRAQDVHQMCGMGVEYIIKNSLLRRSLDNVTIVVIAFSNFKHSLFGYQGHNSDSVERDSVEAQNQSQNILKRQIIAHPESVSTAAGTRDSKASSLSSGNTKSIVNNNNENNDPNLHPKRL